MTDDPYASGHRPPAPRQPQPGELLFEFYVERTHKFYRVELRDHGEFGIEAQFLDPVDVVIARTFRDDPLFQRRARDMAIAWAKEERKALEEGGDR